MAKNLVKVAKEFNVGSATIVEFLGKEGYTVSNKPNAKIDDEMYGKLIKRFGDSKATKEQAEEVEIGIRPSGSNNQEVAKTEEKKAPTPAAKEPTTPIDPDPVQEVKEEPKVEAPKEVKEEQVESPKLKGTKIVGKIDLDDKAKKSAAKKEAAPAPTKKAEEVKADAQKPKAKEEPKQAVKPKAKEKAAKVEPDKTEKENDPAVSENTPEGVKPGTFRGETPELRGLKVLGKIAIEEKPKKAVKSDKKTNAGDNDAKKRRKRKRVTVGGGNNSNSGGNNNQRGGGNHPGGNRPGQGGGRPGGNRPGQGGRGNFNRRNQGRNEEEVKEVSKKEIEDKIKATMARINSGGKKNKSVKNRKDKRERLREKQEAREAAMVPEKLQVTEFITLSDFASLLDVNATELITALMSYDIIASINQRLDQETINIIAEEFETEIEFISAEDQEDETEEDIDDPADLVERAPIVTVMGHVDHGKTSLLDFIRNANVADGEAGGITQHIGAYEVQVGENKKKITFLDTPGHEAFTAMRARGAKVTDIAIIIVAADDRIMPQTKEAISHAQAAEVPMVFAINKVDKDGANPEKIKQELASMNILVEDWGGEYQSQDISAKTGLGIEELLEKILLVSELQELKANPKRKAIGSILEASLEKGRGYVAKTLVQKGTLQIGDPIVCGEESGKVRALFNERGQRVKAAGPSSPVLVLGLSGAPQAGERFKVMESEQEARQIANKRAQISREQGIRATRRTTLADIGNRIKLGNFKELNLIVKGDMDGSVEALSDSLIKLSVDTVQVNIIHKAVGEIIESDVLLATASDAIIIGFQVRPSSSARKLAENEGIEIKTYSIIYEAIEELKSAIEGLLEPTKEEHVVADLEVRETYKISKVGTVAGCFVRDGLITRNTLIRVIRDGIVVYPVKEGVIGELTSLKRFQDDVKEVRNNMECGLTVKNFNDIKVGDKIEGYEIRSIKQTLD